MPALRRLATPPVLLGGLALASAALLIAWQSHLTFFIDDWDLLLRRRGFTVDDFLDPHARHLIIGPTIVYKAIQATVGMGTQIPYSLASTAAFIATVSLLFVYLRRRLDGWLALAFVTPLLFMGSAFEDLLIHFQIGYFGSMAFGIAALLAIEGRRRHRDLIACLLLLASLTFAEIAIPFALGVAVAIALERGPLRRAWVVLVPFLLYGIWYLGWGNQGPNSLTFDHVASSPAYILDGFASSAGSLLGLGTATLFGGTGAIEWGRPLMVALIALGLIGMRTRFPAQGWLLVALVAGVSFWFLTAANAGFGRPPYASRYQFVGAVFLLMIAAEYLSAWRPGPRSIAVIFAVAAAASIGNLSMLHDTYRALAAQTAIVRGDLGGLEIATDTASPSLVLDSTNSDYNYFSQLEAGPYLSAAGKFGSPAYTPSELATAPEPGRVGADKVLAAALGLALQPLSTAPQARGRCETVKRSRSAPPVIMLPRGGAILTAPPGVNAKLGLRRFATGSFPIVVGTLEGVARLTIPPDRSSRPWQLQVDATGPVTICPI